MTAQPKLRVVDPVTDGEEGSGSRHSAVGTVDSDAGDPGRSVRAGARGDVDSSPSLATEGAQLGADDIESTRRFSALVGRCWSAVQPRLVRLGRCFIPPHLVTEKRPSLVEQWNYARWGEHLPPRGVLRVFAKLYAVLISLPTSWVAYAYEWVWERPSRLIAAAVLGAMLSQVPYVSTAMRLVVTVFTFPLTVWL